MVVLAQFVKERWHCILRRLGKIHDSGKPSGYETSFRGFNLCECTSEFGFPKNGGREDILLHGYPLCPVGYSFLGGEECQVS